MIEQTIKVPDEWHPIAIDRHSTRVVCSKGAFHPDLVDRIEAR